MQYSHLFLNIIEKYEVKLNMIGVNNGELGNHTALKRVVSANHMCDLPRLIC